MTTQPEALRLAGYLDDCNRLDLTIPEAATELRRQHEEIESVRRANLDCVDHFDALKVDYDKAHEALRVALEALEFYAAAYGTGASEEAAITKIKEVLG